MVQCGTVLAGHRYDEGEWHTEWGWSWGTSSRSELKKAGGFTGTALEIVRPLAYRGGWAPCPDVKEGPCEYDHSSDVVYSGVTARGIR